MKLTYTCKYCSQERKSTQSLLQHQLRCSSNPKRIPVSPGNTGNKAWNRGLTKQTSLIVAKYSESLSKTLLKDHPSKTYWTDEMKSKQSAIAKDRNLGGVRPSKRITYRGISLGSTYELTLAKDLDANNIIWSTAPKFRYVDPTGKERTYTPDFYLPDFNLYLDPKNDFLIREINPRLGFNDLTKIKLVESQNNIRVLVLNKHQLNWNVVRSLI